MQYSNLTPQTQALPCVYTFGAHCFHVHPLVNCITLKLPLYIWTYDHIHSPPAVSKQLHHDSKNTMQRKH